MKGGGDQMTEFAEGIDQLGNPMRLADGTPVNLEYHNTAIEMNRRTGFRQSSAEHFTPRFNRGLSEGTPIEITIGSQETRRYKVIRQAMKGQGGLPGVYVAPIVDQKEFDQLKKQHGGVTQPDNINQLRVG